MQRCAVGVMGLLLAGLVGCKPTHPEATAVPTRQPPVTSKPALHPCSLLSDTAVAGVVAGAQTGQRDPADETLGISTCRWAVGEGAVVLQAYEVGPGALARELQSAALEIVDLRRPDAGSAVRLEHLAGIEDSAGAFVERTDADRGIRRAGAVLMVQRSGRLAVLRIPQVAEGDRDAGLRSLTALGAEIAEGL